MHELDGEDFEFHDERAIFFCRGVLETVRKLGWAPNVVHCHGWMSALVPMYLKKAFAEDPIFDNTKVVYSVYDQESNVEIDDDMARKSIITGVSEDDVELIKEASVDTLHKLAIKYADAIIMGSEKITDDLNKFIVDSDKYVVTHQSDEEFIDAYDALYDELLEDVEVYS
jgi:starch synthase